MAYKYNFKLEEQFGRAVNALVGPRPLRERIALARSELSELRPGGYVSTDEAPSADFADRFNDLMHTLGRTSTWCGKGIRDGHRQQAKQLEIVGIIIDLFEKLCRASGTQ